MSVPTIIATSHVPTEHTPKESVILVASNFISEISRLSGPELIKRRGIWMSALEEPEGNEKGISAHIGAIEELIPTANFRGETIPETGLEVLPGLMLIECSDTTNTFEQGGKKIDFQIRSSSTHSDTVKGATELVANILN